MPEEDLKNKDLDITTLVGSGIPNGVDIIIVDPKTLAVMDEDWVGEIFVDSPSKAIGYWNKEKETENFFVKLPEENRSPDKSYLRTGDLGFFHNGELFICGRQKDLIIVRGRNIWPQDLEETVETCHELIRRGCVAAFSISNGISTEKQQTVGEDESDIVIMLETRKILNNSPEEAYEIARIIFGKISEDYQLSLRGVVLMAPHTIFKGTSGKIQRSKCRKHFIDNELSSLQDILQENPSENNSIWTMSNQKRHRILLSRIQPSRNCLN